MTQEQRWIRPGRRNPCYFEYADGKCYIPIGLNLSFFRGDDVQSEDTVLTEYHRWMSEFAKNGGNFIRIWLGVPFFNIMSRQAGVIEEKPLQHIQTIVRWAEELGLKIKFTMEHFRRIQSGISEVESFPGVVNFVCPVYHRSHGGPCESMCDYFTMPESRKLFLLKAQALAKSGIGNSSAIIALELWNEINSVDCEAQFWRDWSDFMLVELQKLFPHQMIVQNLGSFSSVFSGMDYDYLSSLKNNAFLQVHRYLDLGAELDVCHGAMDRLCADAVRELRDRNDATPALLSEAGAVEPNHSSYSLLYQKDTQGTILHDLLFAPFFAGSAGGGQAWHWDSIYISRHNLFWHFARFQRAIAGFDPVKEDAKPFYTETQTLRIYGLRGRFRSLLWCRDKNSDWKSELQNGKNAEILHAQRVPCFAARQAFGYLPWEDFGVELSLTHGWITLPDFQRSCVLSLTY